jgi:serine/threonine protein kinase
MNDYSIVIERGTATGLATSPVSDDGSDDGRTTARRTPEPEFVLQPGATFAQYEIIKELGRGGMGVVFMARDTRLGRVVAIKFLLVTNPMTVKRFLVEAQTTARCTHENIVVIHEVSIHQGFPYMVLEFLEGAPLTAQVRGRTLTPGRVVELMIPVARALIRAHEFGIVHRDLKTDNIFLTRSGTLKVLDFGIAKLFTDADATRGPEVAAPLLSALANLAGVETTEGSLYETLSSEGRMVGTLPYMSPEQLRGDLVDERTDLWACGIIMFRMLSGLHPLPVVNLAALADAAKRLDVPHRSIGAVVPSVPEPLVRLVDGLLRKPVGERTATARALLDTLEGMLPARAGRRLGSEESPYPGLAAFQEGDAERFFGRRREVARAVGLLRDLPLLAVVGPSGAGKSSFVRAGLIPELKAEGVAWETWIIRPGRDPLTGFAELLASAAGSAGSVAETVARLRAEPGWFGQALRERARRKEARLLLLVDQFEELFTLVPDEALRALAMTVLSGVADDAASPLRVVLSMRSDFLHRVAEHPRFADAVMSGLLLLGPPDGEGLREAIVGPAEQVDYAFEEPAMVEEMLAALRGSSAPYPLMQFCLSALWTERDPRRRLLMRAAFTQMGGVAGALAKHADALVATMSQAAQQVARAMFQRLVTSEGTRAIVEHGELLAASGDRAEAERVLRVFVDGRLLLLHQDTQTVEIVHEALVTQWPTLRRWMEEAQEDVVLLEQVRAAARQWEAQARAPGLLWRGEQARDAQRHLARLGAGLPARERQYLEAVVALERRTLRRRKLGLATAVAVMGLVGAGSVVGMLAFRRQEAQAQTSAAEAARQRDEAQRALSAYESEKRQRESAVAGKAAADAKVAQSAEELQRLLAEQVKATETATQAERDARRQKEIAEQALSETRTATAQAKAAEDKAVAAMRDAERARDEAQRLLEKERRRVAELEKRKSEVVGGELQ